MKIFLGIDFGTTQTIVTMIREGSKYEPEIVEIDGQRTVDTALRLDAEDNVLFFGQNALERMHEAPEDTFYNFKTAIGSGKTFRSSCKDYTPETLTFLFLRHLRQKLEKKYFNVGNLTAEKDIYCTIGCPASWNEKQRSTLVDLAEKAGFPNVSCCDEPFGVIYYYHFRGELPLTKTRNILVYDFGGGTTDVAIEEISPDSVRAVAGRAALVAPKVLAAAGISNLGGKDFDERLRDHFIEEMGGTAATFGVKDSRILENYAKLLKEALSISIDNGVTFVEKVVPMLFSRRSSHKLALSKKEFERICGSFIERLEEPIYDALNTATFGVDQVDDVIIAGGSSRLYYVKSRVKALFPKSNIVTSANPVEVIAKGLALYGRSPVAEAKPGGVLQEKEKEGSAQSADTKVLLSTEDTKPERQKRPWGQKWLPVAAAVAVMAFGGIYFYSLQKNTETVSTGSTPVQATQTAKETVNPGVSVKETEQTLESSDEQYALGDKYYKEGDYPQAVEWYRKAAEQGHTSGQNSLGYMYQHGLGVTQDHKQAIEWYRKAADQGDASGQSSLGDMYWQGLGVSQDYKQAVEWYRKAAEQGHTSGQNNPGYMYRNLGYMYRYGLGVSQDYKQAIEWYRKAAEQGNAFAQNSLSDMYRQGTGVTLGVSVKETEQTLESSDEQYALGLKYYKERDYRQAMEWYRKAAEQGNASAQNTLGDMYRHGLGVTWDYKEAVEWYRKAADQGNAVAQYNLGYMYERGLGVTQDYKQAVEWYRKAADQGNVFAQNNLGYMYRQGLGVTQDYKQAMEWYRKAADQGNAFAQYYLGIMATQKVEETVTLGVSVKETEQTLESSDEQYALGLKYYKERDYRQAMEWYRKAADQGNASAQYYLGYMYRHGLGVTRDYKQAVEWYRKAAGQGNASAQNSLGYMYQHGLGVTQDYKQAVEWYRKAADQGNASAQNNLGYMYQHGLGVSQDYKQAIEWYRKAADRGNASAQNNLGYMYQQGLGVTQDYKQAVEWYRKAADQGYASAQNSLGDMYRQGTGVTRDHKQAVEWYGKAADQGNASAQNNLGYMYWQGLGVSQDDKQAVEWYRKAADQGDAAAQNNLGYMYERGLGVTQDYKQAVEWYRKAADQGNASAQNNLGYMYERGLGVTKDYKQALEWHRKAADQKKR